MIPESQADKLLAPIYTTYTDVETTILAHTGDLQITLICSKPTFPAAQQRVDELAEKIEEALEDWLYSSQGDSLEQIVLYYLGLRQATLAVAESCTGGLIAQRITSVPGASRSFLGGVVVYSDEFKTSFADVPAKLIAKHGAVSAEVAKALRRRHPRAHRRNSRPRRHRHRRPHRRHRFQTRRPRLRRRLRRTGHERHRPHLPRRSRTRPRMGRAAGPRSRPPPPHVSPRTRAA